MRRATRIVLLLAALHASLPALACAQASDPSAEAAALVERGLDLRESGDDVQARTLITQAYALAPTPRTAAQLGLVEQALGLWADAERHLQEATQHGDDAWIRSHRRALDHSLEVIAANLGTLEVIANVPDATVSIRGSVVATLPSPPVRVQVGPTEIVVAAPGYRPETFAIGISAGALSRQLVELEPLPPPEPVVTAPPSDVAEAPVALAPPVAPPSPPSGPTFVWSWVALALTAASGGVAIGTGVQAQSQYDGLSRTCGGAGCTDAQISASGLEGWQTATNALAISAGVLGAVTVAAFIVEGTTTGGTTRVAAGPGGVTFRTDF